ncbi:hydrogenase maturation nickel metallochaperone HypA [Mameliella sp. CS4]|uniref:hydrogenase maturation nickel metallochaperone HypA n=1 Tax=Mameliella sp. CS4 TaxID=2862329 RepID=UPI001C601440|nr:hydrogenase maturation nickel metallochaperone HypA [Mameliella sp. CS4]MBW4984965.1 hydrogenase maturation nickel metallochaperone HypA [Mameliella sp. CS4]
MHEMSLCEGIRRVIEDQARKHNVARIRRVRVEIGRFAGVETGALHFAFDVVMRGSVAEGAELVTLELPGRAMCYDCMKEVEIMDRLDPCPTCGGGKLMPQGGDEMRIKDLEVA